MPSLPDTSGALALVLTFHSLVFITGIPDPPWIECPISTSFKLLDPLSWFFIRILTGISLSGIFVIMESWLNDKSTNETRGSLLSIYMIITFTFLGIGSLLLNLSDPAKVNLFILVSILLSFALIPILLTKSKQPDFENPKRLHFYELFKLSPLGFVGAIIVGLSHSTVFGLGAVYAKSKGLDDAMIDRLFLDKKRINAIAKSLNEIAKWPDPVGKIISKTKRPNGLEICKVSVPIGVLLVIYESRPNVTTDASALCLKSGNSVILKCGSESLNSSKELLNCCLLYTSDAADE